MEEIRNPNSVAIFEQHSAVALPNQIANKFDKEKILGIGDYGKVFLGEFRNEKVAVKRIKLSKVKRHTRNEELQRLINHPNVVKLLYVEDDPACM
jgi:serine/threonine protein kinase